MQCSLRLNPLEQTSRYSLCRSYAAGRPRRPAVAPSIETIKPSTPKPKRVRRTKEQLLADASQKAESKEKEKEKKTRIKRLHVSIADRLKDHIARFSKDGLGAYLQLATAMKANYLRRYHRLTD